MAGTTRSEGEIEKALNTKATEDTEMTNRLGVCHAVVRCERTLYLMYLQQIQTISTNPDPPNVLLITSSLAAILEKWPGIQLSWDVGLR